MATQTSNLTTKSKQPAKTENKGNQLQNLEKRFAPAIGFFTKCSNDWTFTFSGTLAYSLLTALLPIAIALLAILGFVLGGNPDLHKMVIDSITGLFPGSQQIRDAADAQITKFTSQAAILAIISIILAFFGGSRLFLGLEGFLDIVYRVRPRPFIQQNLMAFGMMLLFIILVPLMVFASLIPSTVFGVLQNVPIIKYAPGLGIAGGILSGLLSGFLLFLTIFVVVPNQRISFKNSWCGALVSAILLEFFIGFVFPFYTANFLGGYTGQILFAVVILLFLYYFALILLLGAEVNAYFFEKIQPIPNDLATFVSTAAGTLNKDIPHDESEAHVDPKPTVEAGKALLADVRKQEEQTVEKHLHKQQQMNDAAAIEDRKQERKEAEKAKKQQERSNKILTLAQVGVGTALAFVISLLRLRRK